MTNQAGVTILTAFLSEYTQVEQEEIDFLQSILVTTKFDKKEIIHHQGNEQKHIGFVVKRAIRFYHTDENGNEDTFDFAYENMPIGQYRTLISSEKAPASAQTFENTEVIIAAKEDFLAFLQKFPKYYQVVAEFMGEELANSIERNKLSRISPSRNRYTEFCDYYKDFAQRISLT